MKSILISIAISIAAVLHSSQFAFAEIDLKSPFARLRPGHSLAFADISDQCVREIQEINENSDLNAALAKLESCPSQTEETETGGKITTDYSTCSSAGEYQLACTAAGGKIIPVDSLQVACKGSSQFSNQTVDVSFLAKNLPDCVGMSCDGSIYADEGSNKELEAFESDLETLLGMGGVSVDCTLSSASGSSSDSGNSESGNGDSESGNGKSASGNGRSPSATIWNKFALIGGLAVFLVNLL